MATNENNYKSPQHAEPACADESDAKIAARQMARGLGGFNIEPPAVSDGRLLAIKVIAAVIGIIGIALLAFPDPMRKSVTVAGLSEGTELSLGTALESGNWLVPVADLDKTFVGAPMSFVGVMTVKVTLKSATGKHLDTRNIRFEWGKPEFYSAPPAGQTEQTRGSTSRTSGRPPVSETDESFAAPLRPDPSSAPAANCLTSADEVRTLAPKAWPKWTYGPHGERCWYSGRKPVFRKEMPAQVEVIPPPLSDDTRSQASSNKTQSPACLASAAEVRKLTPNAWPKWTYGPHGEQCWYSGEKPVFGKAR